MVQKTSVGWWMENFVLPRLPVCGTCFIYIYTRPSSLLRELPRLPVCGTYFIYTRARVLYSENCRACPSVVRVIYIYAPGFFTLRIAALARVLYVLYIYIYIRARVLYSENCRACPCVVRVIYIYIYAPEFFTQRIAALARVWYVLYIYIYIRGRVLYSENCRDWYVLYIYTHPSSLLRELPRLPVCGMCFIYKRARVLYSENCRACPCVVRVLYIYAPEFFTQRIAALARVWYVFYIYTRPNLYSENCRACP